MMRSFLLILGILLLGPGLIGCAPGYPETGQVSGTVTLNDRPLGGGEIQFISDEGQVARGSIEPDGTYRLSTFLPEDGAVPGHHRVIIRPAQSFRSGAVGLIVLPKRFADPDSSGLTAQVNPGMNQLNFRLQAIDSELEEEPSHQVADTP